MRRETYIRQSNGTTALVEITELLRDAQSKARYHRENPPGTVVEDRDATPTEAQMLVENEHTTKREEARARAIAAIKTNATQTPWGKILYDLAIAQGLIEPE